MTERQTMLPQAMPGDSYKTQPPKGGPERHQTTHENDGYFGLTPRQRQRLEQDRRAEEYYKDLRAKWLTNGVQRDEIERRINILRAEYQAAKVNEEALQSDHETQSAIHEADRRLAELTTAESLHPSVLVMNTEAAGKLGVPKDEYESWVRGLYASLSPDSFTEK